MAYTFPLQRGQFWTALRPISWSFDLTSATSTAETGGGEVLTATRGTRLWTGTVHMPSRRKADQDKVRALIDLIQEPGASFLAYDWARKAPQSDPTGAQQGAATCAVASVGANRRDLTLSGLPSGFVLTVGDHLCIPHLGNPMRYYLGRVIQGATFASGQATIEVMPSVPLGVQVNDAVQLRLPFCKAVYLPGSFQGVSRGQTFDSGFSFSWVQTFR